MREIALDGSRSNEMVVTTVNQIMDNGKNCDGKSSLSFARAEVQKYLPQDLLPKITILLQDSGDVTISPRELTRSELTRSDWSRRLTRSDWSTIDEKVKQMGGLWISSRARGHWIIPFSRAN